MFSQELLNTLRKMFDVNKSGVTQHMDKIKSNPNAYNSTKLQKILKVQGYPQYYK